MSEEVKQPATASAASPATASSPSGFAPWHGPHGPASLRTLNSLTGTKTPFQPLSPPAVSWYICGPTVYDSAHLGHARAYVTFDILRRTLEHHYGYRVRYVMNVTDIDDKIIVRARKNHLLADYARRQAAAGDGAGAVGGVARVAEDVRIGYEEGLEGLRSKREESIRLLREAKNSRQREEMEERIAQDELKLTNMQRDQAAFLAAQPAAPSSSHNNSSNPTTATSTSSSTSPPTVSDLIDSNASILSDRLDRQLGGTVTDQSIFTAHAKRYEREFLEDMELLNVREPTVLTRVTEYIDEIVAFIQRIVRTGVGYESGDGSIYFSVKAFVESQSSTSSPHHYGKLSPASVGNVSLTAEAEGQLSESTTSAKRHSSDFALWKASKPGEPAWPSPWGQGRPGWHIECSAMASDVIGERMDIHSGGMDLKFPHHDNELAQSEAALGCDQWVNHFWHAGHLSIKGLKMSKSLKNFITIRQLLQSYSWRQVRLLFLLSPWEAGINFSEEGLSAAKTKEAELNEFFLNTAVVLRQRRDIAAVSQKWTEADKRMEAAVQEASNRAHAALCDNFDYPTVMGVLSRLIQDSNKYRQSDTAKRPLLLSTVQLVDKYVRLFGLTRDTDTTFGFAEGSASGESEEKVLDALCEFRDGIRGTARTYKSRKGDEADGLTAILQLCDRFRDDTLIELGVRVEDGSDAATKSVWKREDADKLRKERRDKRREEIARKRTGVDNKIKKLAKEAELLQVFTAQTAAQTAGQYFAGLGLYSQYDDSGLPSHDKDGKELSKGGKKAAKSEWDKRDKARKAWEDKVKERPHWEAEVKEERERLEKERAGWEDEERRLDEA